MLIYIHGFNSSALSFKAGLVARRMAALGRSSDFQCPELPHRPAQAIALLESCVKDCDPHEVALIGSSLGGFYATWLAERYGVRAVLVNPAVRPYELLTQALGRQKNLYTHAEYEFTQEHLAELRALEVTHVTPSRYLLITRTGDEVLDYRQAVEMYRGCTQLVVEGGDHGFGDFERYLDRALTFCGIAAP
ncbi:MAG TPA: YqiA/YcfP family alpha/beta fold hydrolase [Burkholderiales bacterium]|nr:YqiA/YcfP family alpha/beta fold hydrolase [Burkholderiales bacterium]